MGLKLDTLIRYKHCINATTQLETQSLAKGNL